MNRSLWLTLLALIGLLYLFALPITVIEPDGAVYAVVAKTMVLNGDYLNLYHHGREWLDKPHFQFWVTALSYHLFGINTFAYKLPALLFVALAAFYTFRFTRELYGIDTARLAVLILLTAEHLIISNIDVRAEPFLTGLVMAAVYHFYRVRKHFEVGSRKSEVGIAKEAWSKSEGAPLPTQSPSSTIAAVPSFRLPTSDFRLHLILGALFTAAAVMTKGIYLLFPIGIAVIGDMTLRGDWRQMLRPHWLLVVLLTGLFITPELFALHHQFDAHPEKTVFGQTGVSGIRFFLWDSQWGRFSNSGPIRQSQGDKFFFLHTLLWAFLPWALLLYAGIVQKIKRNLPRINPGEEFYTLAGTLAPFLLFSLSGFQLPYYINILFPFFAVLTADYVLRIRTRPGLRFLKVAQYLTIALLLLALAALHYFYRPAVNHPLLAGLVLLIPVALFFLVRPGKAAGEGNTSETEANIPQKPEAVPAVGVPTSNFRLPTLKIVWRTILAALLVNYYLALVFYPDLLRYQAGTEAARYVNRHFPGEGVALYEWQSSSFEFFFDGTIARYEQATAGEFVLEWKGLAVTTPEGLEKIRNETENVKVIESFEYQRITMLTLPFINHRTREEALGKRYLVRLLGY